MQKHVVVRQFGGPEVLQLEPLNTTTAFRCLPHQVIVKIHAFGINPVETYIRNGFYDPLPSLPYTPGTDAAGVVAELGSGVHNTQLRVGSRVWITGSVSGAYASSCICNEEDVHVLPDSYSFEAGACLGIPYRTAHRSLRVANAKHGESVLVHGATGGVGIATVQFARILGMHPIIASTSSSDPEVTQMLMKNGAHKVVKHGECDELVDVIIEALANANLAKDLKLMKKHGRVVIVGSRGDVTISPRDLMRSEGSILGIVGAGTLAEKLVSDTAIQNALDAGIIHPIVGHVYNLDGVSSAHEEVITHAGGTKGKIVVKTE